jgi:hypothetical protein
MKIGKIFASLLLLALLQLFLYIPAHAYTDSTGDSDPVSVENTDPFFINAGLNDAWFDLETAGQGFFFTVFPEAQIFFLSWFTFDTEPAADPGSAVLGDAGQRWLTAQGSYVAGDTVTLDVVLTTGGQFDSPLPAAISDGGYGTITIWFESCSKAELEYEIPTLDLAGAIQLGRIVDDNVALCEELGSGSQEQQPSSQRTEANQSPAAKTEQDPSAGPFFINAGLNDAWFDLETAGQGFFFTVFPEAQIFFLSWFTFDTEQATDPGSAVLGDAGQRWLTAQGSYVAGDTVSLDVVLTTGGQFDSPLPAAISDGGYGTITIRFDNCSTAQLEYGVPTLGLAGAIELGRIVEDNVPLCEQLSDGQQAGQPRGRPHIDQSLGYNVILSDLNTPLRGVSLSLDGGDPYGSIEPILPSQESLNSLATEYGFNLLHVYLEGDALQNPNPAGVNEALADILVERTAAAGLYLMITIGNNGENGAIHSMQKTLDFWSLYAAKYRDETHVLFEAHNEPVAGQVIYWRDDNWDDQVQMYNHIRGLAPDTMILLGSFMSFNGATETMYGADYIKDQTGDPNIWDNAAFAWHGYWDLPGIESTIYPIEQAGTGYPALHCTEFWPGDTENGYNAAFEAHHMGWAQFQWLNAQDLDLDNLKNKLERAGTVWRPELPQATWPTAGQPDMPAFGSRIGIYSHFKGMFVRFDGDHLKADSAGYTASASDSFTLVDAGNGFVALQADSGKYLSADGASKPMSILADQVGVNEMWEWMQLCPEQDVPAFTLRPWGGGGHLIGELDVGSHQGKLAANADDASHDGEAAYSYVTSATVEAPAGCAAPPPPSSGPYYGTPMSIPTDSSQPHPFNASAPANLIYASDFDHGGEGVAYHDVDNVNWGGAYRFDVGVDIEAYGGFTNVGWIENGEWLNFTVDVESPGDYVLTARVSSAEHDGEFHVEMDGVNVTGRVFTPNTGAWNNYRDVQVNVNLQAGTQELRMVSAGGFNLISFDFRKRD